MLQSLTTLRQLGTWKNQPRDCLTRQCFLMGEYLLLLQIFIMFIFSIENHNSIYKKITISSSHFPGGISVKIHSCLQFINERCCSGSLFHMLLSILQTPSDFLSHQSNVLQCSGAWLLCQAETCLFSIGGTITNKQ